MSTQRQAQPVHNVSAKKRMLKKNKAPMSTQRQAQPVHSVKPSQDTGPISFKFDHLPIKDQYQSELWSSRLDFYQIWSLGQLRISDRMSYEAVNA